MLNPRLTERDTMVRIKNEIPLAQLRTFTPTELHAEIEARLSRRGIQPTGHAADCSCEGCQFYRRRYNAVYRGLQTVIAKR